MSVPLADTEYIKRMVGDALAKGCAATMAANPADPVEFLGQWLLQCVLNVTTVRKVYAAPCQIASCV